MTPLFLRGRRKSGAVGLVRRNLSGEAWGGTRFQIRLGALQTLANGLAEVGRKRQIGDAWRAFVTRGGLERRRNEFGYLWRPRQCVWAAIPNIRVMRDKDRYHGYPEHRAKDHGPNQRQNAGASLGPTLFRALKGFPKLRCDLVNLAISRRQSKQGLGKTPLSRFKKDTNLRCCLGNVE